MRPNILTFLRRGLAFGGHRGFVETVNWVIRFVDNLKGDGITCEVDRTDSDHPVIRVIGGASGGGSTSGFSGTVPVVTAVKFNEDGDYKLKAHVFSAQFANGVLQNEPTGTNVQKVDVFETTSHREQEQGQ